MSPIEYIFIKKSLNLKEPSFDHPKISIAFKQFTNEINIG
jgi:hypothetical protein